MTLNHDELNRVSAFHSMESSLLGALEGIRTARPETAFLFQRSFPIAEFVNLFRSWKLPMAELLFLKVQGDDSKIGSTCMPSWISA